MLKYRENKVLEVQRIKLEWFGVCCRLVMKKQVHKKTIIRDGKEETIVTEDTHVEQDDDGPEELRDSMQQAIDQFMEGGGPNVSQQQ